RITRRENQPISASHFFITVSNIDMVSATRDLERHFGEDGNQRQHQQPVLVVQLFLNGAQPVIGPLLPLGGRLGLARARAARSQTRPQRPPQPARGHAQLSGRLVVAAHSGTPSSRESSFNTRVSADSRLWAPDWLRACRSRSSRATRAAPAPSAPASFTSVL